MIERRMPGPFYASIAILEVLSALLIERCMKRVFSVFEQKIVVVRIRLHARGDLREILHQDLQRCAVEQGMMHVKKYIAGFFCLKDPAAEQFSADDLERVNQSVLDKPEFEL